MFIVNVLFSARGAYYILRVLGRGGMGWDGRHQFKRHVKDLLIQSTLYILNKTLLSTIASVMQFIAPASRQHASITRDVMAAMLDPDKTFLISLSYLFLQHSYSVFVL